MLMTKEEAWNAYFEWMYDLVCGEIYSKDTSFRKLLMRLHDTEFVYSHPKDANRASDGEGLRYRFLSTLTDDYIFEEDLGGPCSVLEMMIALAIRCEEDIMDDTRTGDRTSQWFWIMIVNLGLGSMVDSRFDKKKVDYIIKRFLDREYGPDGKGGLFRVKDLDYDMRDAEIWYQLCWYLNGIT